MSLGKVFPLKDVQAITPSDTVDVAGTPRALLLTVAGDVKLTTKAGTTVTLTGLAAGVFHLLEYSRVYATGTTATGLFAGY